MSEKSKASKAESWRNNTESVQRGSVSKQTNDRRYGTEVTEEPTDNHPPAERGSKGFDADGIPTGI